MARVAAILAGLAGVPGTTINRYCSSSVQTTRMAMHAIRAGEGDVFISGGVETVSRCRSGNADYLPGTMNSRFNAAVARTERFAATNETWDDRTASSFRMSTS